jgi:hypothetical protein
MTAGCSKEPPVEKEVVHPAAPPKVNPHAGGAGLVGSSHQQESQVAQEKMTAPAAPAPPLAAKPGYKPAQAGDKSGELHFLVPEGWQSAKPTSMMRIYQVNIPPAEGDALPAEIAFFAPIGGSVEDNINRWTGQFSQPDGSSSQAKVKVEDIQGDNFTFKLVELSGTMLASSMAMMAPQPERPGWKMLGAIIETPSGPWYIKGTGPEKTMDASRAQFVEMCKSVQVAGPAMGQ